jgi:hypothetical protein
VRSASVQLLTSYASSAGVRLQIYPGRPRSLNPPVAFVDSIRETRVFTGPTLVQRSPTAHIIVLHGLFDSKEAVDQGDAFIDGFLAYCDANYHAAGARTLVGVVSSEDEPNYVPDWLPSEQQHAYYATTIDLEGFATDS